MKRFFHQITSYFLLAAFLFAITPKEFIHAFTGHQDTEHCCPNGIISVSVTHIHCQVLQLQVNPFKETEETRLPVQDINKEVKSYPRVESHSFTPAPATALRGPPASA